MIVIIIHVIFWVDFFQSLNIFKSLFSKASPGFLLWSQSFLLWIQLYYFIIIIFFFMWAILKDFIEHFTILFLFYVLVFWPKGMWYLSSSTGDGTHTPCIGR